MAATAKKLTAAVEEYLAELRRIRATGGGTGELSYYPPLNNLLNAVGGSLRPKVYCVSQLAQQGAGHPDFGLYAAKQVSKGQPKQGQLPEGGVVEVKAAGDDAWITADGAQVSRYWDLYRLALVTNTRDFVLLGEDSQGNLATLETFRLAGSAADFEAKGNLWIKARQRESREDFSRGTLCRHLADNFGNGLSSFFPAWLRYEGFALDGGGIQRRPNLSAAAQQHLDRLGLEVEDLFHHVLAVLHDPAYREAHAGALRMEWPRIPLPGRPEGDALGGADELRAPAPRGRELAALLDPETPVAGVTAGPLRPELAAIAVPSTAGGRNMTGDDFALTAGWGHFGTGDAVMPGQGRAVEREYTAAEGEAQGDTIGVLGDTAVDVHLNNNARWSNVPAAVWNYKLRGYQVLKKWLSYRESKVLGRNLLPEEVQHFTDTARRIAAIMGTGNRV